MICFNDKSGKQWTLDLNVGSAIRVKAETGIDLVNVVQLGNDGADTTVLQKISDDVYLLVKILYSLCKMQIEKEGLSDEEFAGRFDAATIENALDALIQEIINFSQPLKKKLLSMIYEKSRGFRAKAQQQLETVIESKEFQSEMDEQLNRLFLNTPESSE